jgi:hypothetical protein
VLAPGNYGDLKISYSGVGTYNVDAKGNTDFVTITGAPDWASVVNTVSISGARGFVINAIMAKSTIQVGAPNEESLLLIGGNAATPTRDILVGGWFESFTGWGDVRAQYEASGTKYANEQAFMLATMRLGVVIRGDDQPGVHNHCISVAASRFQFVGTGAGIVNSSNVLLSENNINHFGEDGIDLLSNNVALVGNKILDPINLANGVHPDGHQTQNAGFAPGPYFNVTLDRETVIERTEPNNPYPQHITFAQVGQTTNLRVTNSVGSVSNCPGLNIGDKTHNSVIANNTIVGNGIAPGRCAPSRSRRHDRQRRGEP